jgi:hypothetical protein
MAARLLALPYWKNRPQSTEVFLRQAVLCNVMRTLFVSACASLLVLFPRLLIVHGTAPSPTLMLDETLQYAFPSPFAPVKPLPRGKPILRDKLKPAGRWPHLEGIIYEEGKESRAVMEDQILAVGDSIGGFTVEEIKPTLVIVSKEGERYSLALDGRVRKIEASSQ